MAGGELKDRTTSPDLFRPDAKQAPPSTGGADEERRQPNGSAADPAPKLERPARESTAPEDPGPRPTERNRLEDELRGDRERAGGTERPRGGEERPGGDGVEDGR